ncbi:hypothetical protein LDL48_17095 [Wangella sp. NEAU-J3]|nr:hypothetical protein [Jidongwangia harbinensis]MCA2214570.1 hypothetical protein [Jidongwangia harbinensis]
MTTTWWTIAFGLLLAAGAAAVWPMNLARHRLRGGRPRRMPVDLTALRAWTADLGRRQPRRLVGGVASAAASLALLVGGPVAAVLGGVYAALAARAVLRRAARRRAASARSRSLDDLCALAADLRAGLPPADLGAALPAASLGAALSPADPGAALSPADLGAALLPAGLRVGWPSAGSRAGRLPEGAAAGAGPCPPDRRIAGLTAAIWRLAERTGAPAADLVERLEADARAADRAMASAAAQSAGAQATALLLAALPLGGIALGYGIGVDPLAVLLHTGPGAACAIGAVLLQCAGLLWADRLVGPTR